MSECPMCGQNVRRLHLPICTSCYERVVRELWTLDYDAMTVSQFKTAMIIAAKQEKQGAP